MMFQGFYTALMAGLLDGTPDIRLALVMSGFSGETEEDAVYVADITTLDEFDGVGYSRHTAQNVVTGYDTTANEWRLDFDSGDGSEFGAVVAAGSDDMVGMLVMLYVDGTPANDYVLGYTTDGGFPLPATGSPVSLTLPAEGLLFIRAAA